MIQTKIIHGEVDILLIAGLPGDAECFSVAENKGNIYLLSFSQNGHVLHKNKLPPGNWQPINWLDKISEEEANELVEYDNERYYKDYLLKPTQRPLYQLRTAKKSLLSLVESDEEATVWKNIYLLKKID